MKKILTAFALLITVACSSQTKDTTKKEPIRGAAPDLGADESPVQNWPTIRRY